VLKMVEPGQTAEGTIGSFRNLASKYEMMLGNLAGREGRVREKIEEIRKSISALSHLSSHQTNPTSMSMEYELGDTLLAKATLPAHTSAVYLWLGANVLLEYPLDEARALLEQKLTDNDRILERLQHDQKFTREQLTTTEVSASRLINHVIESRKVK